MQKLAAPGALEGDPSITARLLVVSGKIVDLVAVKEKYVSRSHGTIPHPALSAENIVDAVSLRDAVEKAVVRRAMTDSDSLNQAVVGSGGFLSDTAGVILVVGVVVVQQLLREIKFWRKDVIDLMSPIEGHWGVLLSKKMPLCIL